MTDNHIDHVHGDPYATEAQLVRSQLTPGWYKWDDCIRTSGYDDVMSKVGDCPICLHAIISALVCAITGRGDGGGSDWIMNTANRDPDIIAAGLIAEEVFNGDTSDDIADQAAHCRRRVVRQRRRPHRGDLRLCAHGRRRTRPGCCPVSGTATACPPTGTGRGHERTDTRRTRRRRG